jgi:hypothetical protein
MVMTHDPMRDDEYYPFQKGYVARGSPMPYVIGALVLAILAVVSLNIASLDDVDMLGQNEQITASQPASVNSASYN